MPWRPHLANGTMSDGPSLEDCSLLRIGDPMTPTTPRTALPEDLPTLSPSHPADAAVTLAPSEPLPQQASDPRAPAGYLIERELGRGGMGVVYLARAVALDRPCALKMI